MEPVVIVFAGEYNLGAKDKMRRELSRLATKRRLVLDFSEVTYMDSTCIAELVRMEHRRHVAGFRPAYVVMKAPTMLRIFTALTLNRVFAIVPTIDAAIGYDAARIHVKYAFCGDDGTASVPVDYERVSATG